MRRYDVGDKIRVFVQFNGLDGLPAEPTAVRAGHTSPSGVTTEVPGGSITHDLSTNPLTGLPYVGRYYFDLTFTEGSDEEVWWVRWEGTGAVTAAKEEPFPVRIPQVVLP
jgi:hypothetical protein